DRELVAGAGDDSLDEVLARLFHGRSGARFADLRVDSAFGRVVSARRRMEDDDVATRGVFEVVDEAVDEDALADVERRLHRFRGNLVGLDHPGLDRQRQPQGQRDDDDQLNEPAAFGLRPWDAQFQLGSPSEAPDSTGASSSTSSDAGLSSVSPASDASASVSAASVSTAASVSLASASTSAGGASAASASFWVTPSASTAPASVDEEATTMSSAMPQRRSATRAPLPIRPRG